MLDALRSAAGTWVAKILLLLLVLSFAVWGISGQVVNGVGGSNVLTAGDTKVSLNEYRLAYDRQIDALSRQFGTPVTREQANAIGVGDQVLSQLVAGAVLDEEARKLGLGLSRDRVASLTGEDPAFRGPDGKFNREQFEAVLRQAGVRPEDYLRNRGQVAIRQQIVEAVSDGLQPPDTFLRALAIYRGEGRTAEFILLPRASVEPIAEPGEAALKTFFDANKATYAAPEYRKLSYAKLEPEDIADISAITQDQVRQDYEANRKRFVTPESRTIEQIVFATPDAAAKAANAIGGGATFEKVVADQGKTLPDVLLGTFTREQVPDKNVADAAFGLTPNAVSPVVQGAFGPVLLRVTEIKPEVVRPLSEVTDEIRQDLATSEANRILMDVHDSYEDSRAAGESLREAAAKLKLDVTTVDAVDRLALRPDGSIVENLPASRDLLKAVFETEANVENAPITIGSNGFVFYEVEKITPARERALEEVRAKVVADWKAAEAAKLLSAKAADFQKRLRDGATLDSLASEAKTEKQTKRGLKRDGDDVDFGRAGVDAVFASPLNSVGRTAAPAGDGEIVFKVTEVSEPVGAEASAVLEDERKTYASGFADDLLDQLVARLRSEYDVTVDENAVARALAL